MRLYLDKIGSDCEVFLFSKETGLPVSVEGRLGGTKEAPLAVPSLGEGFAVQEDNVMAEFNIPASGSRAAWNASFQMMGTYLAQYFDRQGLRVACVPSVRMPSDQLNSKQAMTFGCEPDYCVWTKSQNPPPSRTAALQNLRTAGGHVHVSFVNEDESQITLEQQMTLVKTLDMFLGVPLTLYDRDFDRRKMYGKAGSFRLKPYGIEYRVPSNFWAQSELYTNWVYSNVMHAFEFIRNQRNIETFFGEQLQSEIQYYIDKAEEASQDQVREWCRMWRIPLPRKNPETEAEALLRMLQTEQPIMNGRIANG